MAWLLLAGGLVGLTMTLLVIRSRTRSHPPLVAPARVRVLRPYSPKPSEDPMDLTPPDAW